MISYFDLFFEAIPAPDASGRCIFFFLRREKGCLPKRRDHLG